MASTLQQLLKKHPKRGPELWLLPTVSRPTAAYYQLVDVYLTICGRVLSYIARGQRHGRELDDITTDDEYQLLFYTAVGSRCKITNWTAARTRRRTV